MRFLITGLRKEFWPVLINEIIRIVKPGGYIELMEFANPAMQGPTKVPNLVGFSEYMRQLCQRPTKTGKKKII